MAHPPTAGERPLAPTSAATANEFSPLLASPSPTPATRIKPSHRRHALLGSLIAFSILAFSAAFALFLLYNHDENKLSTCRSGKDYDRLQDRLGLAESDLNSSRKCVDTLTVDLDEAREEQKACEREQERLRGEIHRLKDVEGLLEACRVGQATLKKDLGEVEEEEKECEKKKRRLEKDKDKQVLLDFVASAAKLGIGGTSWVSSDGAVTWAFGYASREPFDPSLDFHIYVWNHNLTSSEAIHFRSSAPPTSDAGTKTHIIGYKVISRQKGRNGWWRARDLKAFGAAEMGFEASRPYWYSSAKYEVKVYYVQVEV